MSRRSVADIVRGWDKPGKKYDAKTAADTYAAADAKLQRVLDGLRHKEYQAPPPATDEERRQDDFIRTLESGWGLALDAVARAWEEDR
jgi:hypothetical protein